MPSYGVVQWATGNIGTRSLRHVIEHSDLELVGVYVHSAAQVGRDAGDLCGLPPTGVAATHDINENTDGRPPAGHPATHDIDGVVARRADCGLTVPQQCNVDEVCPLLASGANIVTT